MRSATNSIWALGVECKLIRSGSRASVQNIFVDCLYPGQHYSRDTLPNHAWNSGFWVLLLSNFWVQFSSVIAYDKVLC